MSPTRRSQWIASGKLIDEYARDEDQHPDEVSEQHRLAHGEAVDLEAVSALPGAASGSSGNPEGITAKARAIRSPTSALTVSTEPRRIRSGRDGVRKIPAEAITEARPRRATEMPR